MAPEEALRANIKIIESICQAEHADHPFLSNPLTRESLCMAANIDRGTDGVSLDMKSVAMNNGCNYQEITKGDFEGYVSSMLLEATENGKSPNDLDKENSESYNNKGVLKSIFHGGKCSDPYAVLCSEDNMNFVYGAGSCNAHTSTHKYNTGQIQPNGALKYTTGGSSHNRSKLKQMGIQYGFLFEYESRREKQEFIGIDRAGGQVFDGGKFDKNAISGSYDETTVLPHQNKLKTAYVVTLDNKNEYKVLPLEIDENGQIKDKKWRDFMDLHKPIDDNLKGFMIERRNNMITDYDCVGKETYMNRTLEDINSGKIKYVAAEKYEFKKADPIIKPPVQGYTGATPPPPPIQGYTGTTPPPPPPVQGDSGATPPPPPVEQTIQKFAEMNPQEQGKVILSMRKGINPLLPKVIDNSSMTNTQTKTLNRTQTQAISSIINGNSFEGR